MGLGLSICRRIIESHGGEIRLDDSPGCGTAFLVRLPISQPAFAAPVPELRHFRGHDVEAAPRR